MKTACHTKPKFCLRTKPLENVLFTKYLISVAATLTALDLHNILQT